MKWISVKDRLPNPKSRVLLYKDNDFCTGIIDENEKGWPDSIDYSSKCENPSHWMSLPEKPDENEEKEIPFKCKKCAELEFRLEKMREHA